MELRTDTSRRRTKCGLLQIFYQSQIAWKWSSIVQHDVLSCKSYWLDNFKLSLFVCLVLLTVKLFFFNPKRFLLKSWNFITVCLLNNNGYIFYSHTFESVQQDSNFYWYRLQVNFLEEYTMKSVFPVHLQVVALPFFAFHALMWCITCSFCNKCRNTVNAASEKYALKANETTKSTKHAPPTFMRGIYT